MMESIITDVKNAMKDVEHFLTHVLKKEKLSKDANKKKEELITKISNLRTKIATDDEEKLRSGMKASEVVPEEPEEEYADVEVLPSDDKSEEGIMDDIYDEAGSGEPVPEPATVPTPSVVEADTADDSKSMDDGLLYDDAKMITGPVAANELLGTKKTGYLDKKRKEGQIGIGSWQKRWCVIKDSYFYYYTKPNDKKQKNVVNLVGYSVKSAPHIPEKKNKKKDFCFEITHPEKRDFQFIACSTQDMNDWMEAIQAASGQQQTEQPTAKDSVQPIEEDDGEVYDDVSAPPEGNDNAQPIPEEVVQPNKSVLFTEIIPKQEAEKAEVPKKTVAVMQCSNWEYDYNNIYVAMWDCKSQKSDELNFKRGDFIHVINTLDECEEFKWWIGETKDKVGFFPKEYVMKAYDLEIE